MTFLNAPTPIYCFSNIPNLLQVWKEKKNKKQKSSSHQPVDPNLCDIWYHKFDFTGRCWLLTASTLILTEEDFNGLHRIFFLRISYIIVGFFFLLFLGWLKQFLLWLIHCDTISFHKKISAGDNDAIDIDTISFWGKIFVGDNEDI